MARQIDHLADVSQRPNVRLGVIPWGTEATVYPSSGFELYDRRTVVVGLPSGARFLNPDDPGRPDVRSYRNVGVALVEEDVEVVESYMFAHTGADGRTDGRP